jgi:predicted lipid-binding transport protein (Tim44 family)
MRGVLLGLVFLLLGGVVALPETAVPRAVAQPRSATPAPAAAPAPSATPAPRAPGGRATSRSWMPILGSLFAGGLLGALFGGNVLFGILMIVLLVAIGAFIARLVMRARAEPLPGAQFAGLGSETVVAPPPSQAADMNAIAPALRSGPALPEGFDLAGFVRSAKLNFVRLQIAIDLGNLAEIREFATPQMTVKLGKEIAQRGGKREHGDVVTLNAELVELATEGDMHRARVRFSGMARESAGSAPTGFAEVWQLGKPADGSSGWLLADIERTD